MSSNMRCPTCHSVDVECQSVNREHAHHCNTCGRHDAYRGPAKRKPHSRLEAQIMGWGEMTPDEIERLRP